MPDVIIEVKREVVNLFRAKKLTVAEIREVLADINEALDSISVLKEWPHTDKSV